MARSRLGTASLVCFILLAVCPLWTPIARAQTGSDPTASAVSVEQAIAGLKSSDASVRLTSANAISGKGAAAAIPALLAASKSTDYPFRNAASQALGRINASDPSSRPALRRALIQGLSDPDKEVRDFSESTFATFRSADRTTFAAVIDLIMSRTNPYPGSAISALMALGKPDATMVDDLIRLLRTDSVSAKLAAIRSLNFMGQESRSAIPDLILTTHHPDRTVRIAAITSLRRFDRAASPAIPDLTRALRDTDTAIRETACYTLGSIGDDARSAIPDLARCLVNGENSLNIAATFALQQMVLSEPTPVSEVAGAAVDRSSPLPTRRQAALSLWLMAPHVINQQTPDAALLVSTCGQLLGDSDETIRNLASDILGKFRRIVRSSTDPTIIEGIVSLTRDRDVTIRRTAVATLNRLSYVDSNTMPGLIDALKDPDALVRAQAAAALGNIGNDTSTPDLMFAPATRQRSRAGAPVVPYLIRTLSDTDKHVRDEAVKALMRLGEVAAPAVPILDSMLSNPKVDTGTRSAALMTLKNIGPLASNAVPEIAGTLRDRDRGVRALGLETIAAIGPAAVSALPEVIRLLDQDPDPSVRGAAITALGSIGWEVPGVLPALLRAVDDRESYVRSAAISQLGSRKAQSADVLPALTKIVCDSKRATYERATAQQTLESIANWTAQNVAQIPESDRKKTITVMKRSQEQLSGLTGEIDGKGSSGRLQVAIDAIARERARQTFSNTPTWEKAVLGIAVIPAMVLLAWTISLVRLLVAPGSLILLHDRSGSAASRLFSYGVFRFHPRVLDALIMANRQTLLRQFQTIPSVAARSENSIDLAIRLPDGSTKVPAATDFHGMFAKPGACLQISGKPGSGRTTLACRLAVDALATPAEKRLSRARPMIPIWLDSYLWPGNEGTKGVDTNTAISLALGQLMGRSVAPDSRLLQSLMQQNRLLLIANADRLPQPLPATARLLITTEPTPDAGLTLVTVPLTPEQIERLLPDPEDARQLQRIAADNPVTVEVATLYARYRRLLPDVEPPQSVPALFESAVTVPYSQVTSPAYSLSLCIDVAGKIANACLNDRFVPVGTSRSQLRTILGQIGDGIRLPLGNSRPEPFLEFLENDLGLLQSVGPEGNWVRFSSDAVCLCLAARYLAQSNRAGDRERLAGFPG